MTERQMFKELNSAMKEYGKLYSIETGSSSSGIPDCYFKHVKNKREGWVELKVGKKLKDGSIEIKYRPGQQNFLLLSFNIHAYTLIWYNSVYYLMLAKDCSTDIFEDKLYLETLAYECSGAIKNIARIL